MQALLLVAGRAQTTLHATKKDAREFYLRIIKPQLPQDSQTAYQIPEETQYTRLFPRAALIDKGCGYARLDEPQMSSASSTLNFGRCWGAIIKRSKVSMAGTFAMSADQPSLI